MFLGSTASTTISIGEGGADPVTISSLGGTAGSGFTGTGGMAGQTFTPSTSFELGSAQFRFWSAGVTGNMTASVYNTAGGIPTTKIEDSTNTIDVSLLPTSDPGPTVLNSTWTFDSVALTGGTMYAIVYTGAGITFPGGNYFIAGRNTDAYDGGTQVYDSSGWTAHPSGFDLDFQIDQAV